MTDYSELLDSVHLLSYLSERESYQRPVKPNSSKDRQVAILYLNGLMNNLAEIIPHLCKIVKNEMNTLADKLQKEISKYPGLDAALKNHNFNSKSNPIAPSVTAMATGIESLYHTSTIIDLVTTKFQKTQDSIPQLHFSKDSKFPFIQLQEMFTRSNRLKRFAKKKLPKSRETLTLLIDTLFSAAGTIPKKKSNDDNPHVLLGLGLIAIDAYILQLQNALELCYGPIFSMLEQIVSEPWGDDWRNRIDIESFNDRIFNNERERKSEAAASKKKKGKKSPPKSPPKTPSPTQSARVVHVPTMSLTAVSVETSLSTPLTSMRFQMMKVENLREGIFPMGLVGSYMPRERTARMDQAYSLALLDRVMEMFQSVHCFTKEGTLQPAARSLLSFGSFQIFLSEERRETAELYALPNITNLALAYISHLLTELRSIRNLSSKGNKVLKLVPRETILYRYPPPSLNIAQRENELFKNLPELLQDLLKLTFESHTESLKSFIQEMQELAAIKDTFGKQADMGGSLTADQVKALTQIETNMQSTLEGLNKMLKGKLPREKEEILRHITKHIMVLRYVPTLLMQFPHQRYLVVPVMMLLISGQYAAENVGLHCGLQSGISNIISAMGKDLHNLQAYNETFEMDHVLDNKGKEILQMLNVGKGFEYIHQHCSENRTVSPFIDLASQSLEWSLAAADRKGIWAPKDRIKGNVSAEKAFAELQDRVMECVTDICSTMNVLVHKHVFNVT